MFLGLSHLILSDFCRPGNGWSCSCHSQEGLLHFSSELFLQKLQFTQTKAEDLSVCSVSVTLKNKADLPTAKPDYWYQTATRCYSEIFNQQGKDLSKSLSLATLYLQMGVGLRFSLPGTAPSASFSTLYPFLFHHHHSHPSRSCCFQGSYLLQILLYLTGTKSTPACALCDQTGANQQCSENNLPMKLRPFVGKTRPGFEFLVLKSVNFSKQCNLISSSGDLWSIQYSEKKTNYFSFTCSFASPQRYRCACHSQSLGTKSKQSKLSLWGV